MKAFATSTATAMALALAVPAWAATPAAPPAGALPSGASVVSGTVTVAQSNAKTLTITQSSASAIVDFTSFSIAQGYTVNIVQPNAQAAQLDRVTGTAATSIDGKLNATGQVYLINPNGIAITSTGKVTVGGGFVASTLAMSDAEFLGARRSFTGNGASAPVSNAGAVTVGAGGYAALLGGTVVNSGKLIVPTGKIALGSGEAATLDFSGDGFLQVTVPTTAGNSTALIQSTGTINAAGGAIIIAAATAQSAARNAINLAGTVAASSVSGTNGSIDIDGGAGGSVAISAPIKVYGAGSVTINYDADAPTNLSFSGKGAISYLNADGSAATTPVTGQALTINGQAYTLVYSLGELDAIDGISAVNGSAITPYGPGLAGKYALANTLNGTGTTFTNALISSTGTLTGNEYPGFSGVLEGLGHTITSLTINSKVKQTGINIALINTLSGTVRDLNLTKIKFADTGIATNLGGIAAVVDSNGLIANTTVAGTIADPKGNASTGEISVAGGVAGQSFGEIINSSASVAVTVGQGGEAGGLVGAALQYQDLTNKYIIGPGIINSFATGAVTGGASANVGGLVGYNYGQVTNSYATGAVTGGASAVAGGLIGSNQAEALGGGATSTATQIANSYATGTVTVGDNGFAGGFVGGNSSGVITGSHASGAVTGGATSFVGGFAGDGGVETNDYATGNVRGGDGSYVGGFAATAGVESNDYAKGSATGGNNSYVGGFVGGNIDLGSGISVPDSITASYATGNVTAGTNSYAGGFAGAVGNLISYYQSAYGTTVAVNNPVQTVTNAYATGSVTAGAGSNAGAFAGAVGFDVRQTIIGTSYLINHFSGSASNVYGTGAVAASSGGNVGGLVGLVSSNGTIANGYFTTDTTGQTTGIGSDGNSQSGNVTGLTASQLQGALPAGFDASIWSTASGSYPFLQSLGPTR